MIKIEFEKKNFENLKELIAEFDTYYEQDEDGEDKMWNFDDVEAQKEIGGEVIGLLCKYINIKK